MGREEGLQQVKVKRNCLPSRMILFQGNLAVITLKLVQISKIFMTTRLYNYGKGEEGAAEGGICNKELHGWMQ